MRVFTAAGKEEEVGHALMLQREEWHGAGRVELWAPPLLDPDTGERMKPQFLRHVTVVDPPPNTWLCVGLVAVWPFPLPEHVLVPEKEDLAVIGDGPLHVTATRVFVHNPPEIVQRRFGNGISSAGALAPSTPSLVEARSTPYRVTEETLPSLLLLWHRCELDEDRLLRENPSATPVRLHPAFNFLATPRSPPRQRLCERARGLLTMHS